MKNREFKILLKKANLNKKKLSEMFNLSYSTVANWGITENIAFPYWLESWLKNYVELLELKEKLEKLK